MILDFIYKFFNDDAKKRYIIYKENQIIEKNTELQLINKLLNYKLSLGEYISIKDYINSQYEYDCSNTELDKAIEYSIKRNVNIHDKKKWSLFPVIIKYKLYNN